MVSRQQLATFAYLWFVCKGNCTPLPPTLTRFTIPEVKNLYQLNVAFMNMLDPTNWRDQPFISFISGCCPGQTFDLPFKVFKSIHVHTSHGSNSHFAHPPTSQHLQESQGLHPALRARAGVDGAVEDHGVRLQLLSRHGRHQLDGHGPVVGTATGVEDGAIMEGADVALLPLGSGWFGASLPKIKKWVFDVEIKLFIGKSSN